MRSAIPLFFSIALLAACSTPAEQAAQLQRQMDNMMLIYGPACEKLGFVAQTDPWRNCILQLSTKDDIERYRGYPDYPMHWRRWP